MAVGQTCYVRPVFNNCCCRFYNSLGRCNKQTLASYLRVLCDRLPKRLIGGSTGPKRSVGLVANSAGF